VARRVEVVEEYANAKSNVKVKVKVRAKDAENEIARYVRFAVHRLQQFFFALTLVWHVGFSFWRVCLLILLILYQLLKSIIYIERQLTI
jgi:hypothetical protein